MDRSLTLMFFVLAVAAQQIMQFSNKEMLCSFSGTSGEMKLQYQESQGSPMQCKLQWSKLQERNTASPGAAHDIITEDSAAGVPLQWKASTGPYTYDGEYQFEYNNQTRVMEVHAYIGSEDKDITVWSGRSVHAYRHQLKWSFRFRVNASEPSNNWDWMYGGGGELCVGMTMGCHESETECNQERTMMQAGTHHNYAGGESGAISVGGRGSMVSSQYVYLDGSNEQTMAQTRLQYRERAQHTYSFQWCFPHFTTEVLYDPTISLAPIAASNVGLIVGVSVACAVVAVAAIVGVVCCVRRRKSARTAAV
jgi:hypothetical protein